jgi:hypothetical protein
VHHVEPDDSRNSNESYSSDYDRMYDYEFSSSRSLSSVLMSSRSSSHDFAASSRSLYNATASSRALYDLSNHELLSSRSLTAGRPFFDDTTILTEGDLQTMLDDNESEEELMVIRSMRRSNSILSEDEEFKKRQAKSRWAQQVKLKATRFLESSANALHPQFKKSQSMVHIYIYISSSCII